ncbi:Ku protein [Allopusillimonas soli]|uniref:Non-homologous end joining protein Ku n=1 Tax=Allopusillimonas soli TaxID=659016 RepID=A0A853F8G8_9BURK|nr:Ku protein [Allopusillimonas soli]NYT36249.1 Ku protein [Allopusillimonas soli]TEA76574.1 Ku protein [Allopusillimonas soli]
MATSSKRALWKGAISFGLVHIPIALHSATASQGIDFDWLDRRTMDPVGYKRVNKVTGKEVDRDDIVKGVEYDDGEYVVLSAEEISAAYPKTTQTIEIESFVSIDDIPFVYLDRPYYTSPIGKGDKVYALLREILHKTNKVGVAKVVIQTRQHLAVLMACGPALILNLLRWSDEIRSWEDLNPPARGPKGAGLTDKEMKMGEQLVEDMSAPWKPEQFSDSFREQILALVREKAEAGETESVSEPESHEHKDGSAKILDLTEMLRRSLDKDGKTTRKPSGAAKSVTKTAKSSQGKRSAGGASKKAASKDNASKDKKARKSTRSTAKKASRKTSGGRKAA